MCAVNQRGVGQSTSSLSAFVALQGTCDLFIEGRASCSLLLCFLFFSPVCFPSGRDPGWATRRVLFAYTWRIIPLSPLFAFPLVCGALCGHSCPFFFLEPGAGALSVLRFISVFFILLPFAQKRASCHYPELGRTCLVEYKNRRDEK